MKKSKIKIVFVLVGIILFSLLFLNLYNDFLKDNSYDKKLSSINSYGYTLSSTDTKVYKDNYKLLEDLLNQDNIDFEEYAKLISKLFVIDVFTLDNKVASTDIGGLEFIHNDLKDNFKENMESTLYKHIESNLDGNRKQSLPIVKDVIINSVFETKYIYNNTEYSAYLISLSIEYEKDKDYQKNIKLTIINDNNKLYIVKGE